MAYRSIDALVEELNKFTPCLNDMDYRRQRDLIIKYVRNSEEHHPLEQQEKDIGALRYGAELHGGLYRKDDSTPYYLHLLEVAGILIDLQIRESKVLCAAILHDVVELLKKVPDAAKRMQERLSDIRKKFGIGVKRLVDYLTKRPGEDKDAYWKRMLAIKDKHLLWRVLAIKYADRIHNIQTLGGVKNDDAKYTKIKETLKWFPEIKTKMEKTLEFLWLELRIGNRFLKRLPAQLDNLLQAALEPYVAPAA
jgi:(p)ppGpp synthase/HD superfamily hydrolase